MEKLNATDATDLKKFGIIPTEETKKMVIKNQKIVKPVFKIPLNLLKYNKNNGRIFYQMFSLTQKKNSEFEDYTQEQFNEEIESLIWESNVPKNKSTKQSIEQHGQMEDGVIMPDGTVIDGNRRFTCLRRLHREQPDNDEYKYFTCAILDKEEEDIQLSDKDIRAYELNVQFGQDEKVDYSSLNKALSCYDDIEKHGFTYKELADNMNENKSNITKMVRTVKLVEELLEFIKAPNDYKLAEDLNVYFALEPLASYISSIENKYSQIDIEDRKNIYFSYLVSVHFELPTQSLRDKLIKKIFKEPNHFKQMQKKFNEDYAEKVDEEFSRIADDESNEKYQKIKDLKNTELAHKMKRDFENLVKKYDLKKNEERPNEILEGVLESLNELNLQPFIEAEAKNKLTTVKSLLEQVEEKIKEIKSNIRI